MEYSVHKGEKPMWVHLWTNLQFLVRNYVRNGSQQNIPQTKNKMRLYESVEVHKPEYT
jgi:hypothetical protein